MEIEISRDGSNWSSVANLTSTPWLKHVDTTVYDNDSWTFRARAYDSDVNTSQNGSRVENSISSTKFL